MKHIQAFLLASLTGLAACSAQAQGFHPTRPVTLVVGFSAGGANDRVAREIGQRLGNLWHQSVIVENKSGASGAIAAASVARSTPDGLRLLVGPVTLTMLPAVQKNLPFDLKQDLAPVGLIAKSPIALTVSRQLDVADLQGFLALAKSRQLFAGTTGPGAVDYFGSQLLMAKAGIDLQDIAYRGGPELLADLMENRVNMSMSSATTVAPHAQGGKLKVLAVTGTARSSVLPSVPTFSEQGIPDLDIEQWWGLFAPAGTPPQAIDGINGDLRKILGDPGLQQAFTADGAVAAPMTVAEFDGFVAQQLANWESVARRTHAAQR